ncbi:uncharacterized protein [Diadema antillarum]|uniref:uncharacterized protein n=2 Tax=Diadema antillarum TaxID=105358 RepID=UPI003A890E79
MKTKYKKLPEDCNDDSVDRPKTRSCLRKMFKCGAVIVITAIFVALCSSLFVDGFTLTYPLHASCKIDWTFDVNCSVVGETLVKQMKIWETEANCQNGGEKCLYAVTYQNDTYINGTHMTPVKHYVDDISFQLTSKKSGCAVFGFSTSETWYAYLDYGTNYCNLHNLITGSGLDKAPGYSEKTDDSICTQYTSADCEKY